MPRRMPWPGSEQLINADQYQMALERLGGAGKDTRTTTFWWEANPRPYKPHPELLKHALLRGFHSSFKCDSLD